MADYQLSIDILGAAELKAAMAQASGVCMNILKRTLDKSAIDVEALSRANAPHKTGALRDSIHTSPAEAIGNNVVAKVGVPKNVPYGRAQEYGTVGMVIHGKSSVGNSFQYIGNIKPKLYMKRAKDTLYPNFVKNMENAVGAIISSLTHGGQL